MSRTFHHNKNNERRVRVRGIRKKEPDLRRIARALIAFTELQEDIDSETALEATDMHQSSKPRRCRTSSKQTGGNK